MHLIVIGAMHVPGRRPNGSQTERTRYDFIALPRPAAWILLLGAPASRRHLYRRALCASAGETPALSGKASLWIQLREVPKRLSLLVVAADFFTCSHAGELPTPAWAATTLSMHPHGLERGGWIFRRRITIKVLSTQENESMFLTCAGGGIYVAVRAGARCPLPAERRSVGAKGRLGRKQAIHA